MKKLIILSISNCIIIAALIFFIVTSCSSFKEVLDSSILKIILACFSFVSLLLYTVWDILKEILEKLERLERKS